MEDKYHVTLVFFDEKDNFEKSLPQIGKEMYEDVQNFENFKDFKNFMENPANNNISILLFIHVFRLENCKGHKEATKHLIKREYPNLKIHWVTSDKPGETSDLINERNNTYRYDEIPEFIDSKHLIPVRISETKKTDPIIKDVGKEFIFLSHSLKDERLVTSFFEYILRLGLNISKENIFYSSHPTSGIPTGEDIPDELKTALEKMTIFIQYVSNDYKESEVCLNEMGAAWLKLSKNRIITLKAPDIGFSDLGFLNIQRIGLCINKKEDLHKIISDYGKFFDCNPADYYKKVDKFLSENEF